MHAFRKPTLFEEVDESFWREPYIAEQILDAHLDPASDDASRRPAVIARSTDWIADLVPRGARLLDLGCGPGLYCVGFNRRGLRVTGLDYSRIAIAYARDQAKSLRHPIEYLLDDYRSALLPSPFDIVTLIYGGICCITDSERDDLLVRIRGSLVPGGLFVFDAFTRSYIDSRGGGWYFKLKDGFWRPGPHLVFERKHEYPEADIHLDRYIVADITRGIETYNMWKHYYSQESLTAVLDRAGFEVRGWYGDLAGSPYHPRGPWIGVVAGVKQHSSGRV